MVKRKLHISTDLSDYPVWEGVLRRPEVWGQIEIEEYNRNLSREELDDEYEYKRWRECRENGDYNYIFG